MPGDGLYGQSFVRREHYMGITVKFSEPITVVGMPRVQVRIGTTSRPSQQPLAIQRDSITFALTPDASEEGALTLTGPILLAPGVSIKGADGSDAVLTFAPVSAPQVLIDMVAPAAPVVAEITPATPDSEQQFTVSGTAQVGSLVQYDLDNTLSGNAAVDAEGKWAVTLGPLSAGEHAFGATARDDAGNYPGFPGSMVTGKIFTVVQSLHPQPPRVTRVDLPVEGTYLTGQTMLVGLAFSAPVKINGNPLLNVMVGADTRQFTFYSYSASLGNVAYFYYKVAAEDDGPLKISGSIALNGGVIQREGTDAALTFDAQETGVVMGIKPTVAQFTPASPTTEESVTIRGTGMAYLTLMWTLDGNARSGSVPIDASGNWSVTLAPVASPGGHTFTAYMRSFVNDSQSTTANFSVRPAPVAPTVAQIVPPAGASYAAGRSLMVGVKFSAPLTVTGAPLLGVRVGGMARQFVYSTYADNTAYFRYEVAADDQGTLVVSGPIVLNGGTIKGEAGGLDAALGFATVDTGVRFTAATTNPPPSQPPPAQPPSGEPPPSSEPPPAAEPPPAEEPPSVAERAASRLINVSSRLQVADAGDAERTLIMGFTIRGAGQQRVLLRGVGPSLAEFGVQAPLPNPRLGLFSADSRVIRENDDWSADMAGTIAQMGAFSLYSGSRDAALVQDLPAGSFSIHVLGNGGTGVALAEIFGSTTSNASDASLTNLSARGFVGRGEAQLGAGFVISGTEPMRVLLRGVGATLGAFGVRKPLSDPVLTLYRGTAVLAQNDNWEASATVGTLKTGAPAEIGVAAAATGAFSLPEGGTDAALLVTLEPGEYTVFVSGGGDATGIGLVEVYEVR